jgi:hypothetical protein
VELEEEGGERRMNQEKREVLAEKTEGRMREIIKGENSERRAKRLAIKEEEASAGKSRQKE